MVDELVQRFNKKHDLTQEDQFRQLLEEFQELFMALFLGVGDVQEECVDVCFVARSIALLDDETISGDVEEGLKEQAVYNLEKSTERDETGKVTDDV